MITLAQVNAVPRPEWMTVYEEEKEGEEMSWLASKNGRIVGWKGVSVGVLQSIRECRDALRAEIHVHFLSLTFDETIDLLRHTNAVAALFADPKVILH